jgi:thiamine biosynthesis lipoprotein
VSTEDQTLIPPPPGHVTAWTPRFDEDRRAVRLGPEPVDLGGIGKGLAVRWAADQIAGHAASFLVEAGGDCYLGGAGPDGTGWRIGVEDPLGGLEPVAVLQLSDVACATSSIRLRQWRSGERRVHHLIDPRTGAPGGAGLLAVTVVGADPAAAEVWSKCLFLCGVDGVAQQAEAQDLAALWVADDGQMGTTSAMDPLLIWRADRVG